MQYEIDYIPVGENEKGGDAITFRYGDFSDPAKQNVVVIDGGTKDSGKKLVEHIQTHYKTSRVDLVVASHLHSDHISGLSEIFENLTVEKFAVLCPWDYSTAIKKMTTTSVTATKLETNLDKSLTGLSNLINLANTKKIKIIQPFQGDQILDGLFVLSPSKEYYQQLLANFTVTPEVKKEFELQKIITFAKDAVNWVAETLDKETLSDDGPDTNPENNSSLVLLLQLHEKKFLFTGDAGKDALVRAINYAEQNGVSLNHVDFFDVPHHGSQRNVGPNILNYLMPKVAFISTPQNGDPKHPSRKVCNALRRRECPPTTTKKGNAICLPSLNSPDRGWVKAEPEPFFDKVEE